MFLGGWRGPHALHRGQLEGVGQDTERREGCGPPVPLAAPHGPQSSPPRSLPRALTSPGPPDPPGPGRAAHAAARGSVPGAASAGSGGRGTARYRGARRRLGGGGNGEGPPCRGGWAGAAPGPARPSQQAPRTPRRRRLPAETRRAHLARVWCSAAPGSAQLGQVPQREGRAREGLRAPSPPSSQVRATCTLPSGSKLGTGRESSARRPKEGASGLGRARRVRDVSGRLQGAENVVAPRAPPSLCMCRGGRSLPHRGD